MRRHARVVRRPRCAPCAATSLVAQQCEQTVRRWLSLMVTSTTAGAELMLATLHGELAGVVPIRACYASLAAPVAGRRSRIANRDPRRSQPRAPRESDAGADSVVRVHAGAHRTLRTDGSPPPCRPRYQGARVVLLRKRRRSRAATTPPKANCRGPTAHPRQLTRISTPHAPVSIYTAWRGRSLAPVSTT